MRIQHRQSRPGARLAVAAAAVCLGAAAGCTTGRSAAKANPDTGPLTLSSSAFASNGVLPISYGCTGTNTSPPLSWHGVAPAGTRSWAIVMQDLDVKPAPWIQWLVTGIPAPQRTAPAGQNPAGATTGTATNGTTGYVGACPPQGKVHHYQFTVYSLNDPHPIQSTTTPARSLHILETTALAKVSLTARFGR